MKTTLNNIRKHSPCAEGWTKLLKSLNKTTADDEPLELSYILESNGFNDALWCLRSIKGIEKESRLYAVFCARQVQHSNDDPIVKETIDVAERFVNGEVTVEELNAARSAAYAAYYANDAAYYAARSASYAAYYADDADDAAWYATRSAAAAAAYSVIREAQKQKFIEMFC